MNYTVKLKPRAQKELVQLPGELRQRIITALEKLENGLAGDVKRLTHLYAGVSVARG